MRNTEYGVDTALCKLVTTAARRSSDQGKQGRAAILAWRHLEGLLDLEHKVILNFLPSKSMKY